MRRIARLALLTTLLGLAVPAVSSAAIRMPVGFQDDPTFRWSANAQEELDRAAQAHASVIRTVVDWYRVAPRRPAHAADSFDPAYNFNDLDAFVRNAQQRGISVLISIWGTPRWANGGKAPNYAPRRLADLRNFAHAVADRYSGRHAGYPYVGRYSVWNEPNLGIFLSPEFSKKGAIVGPRIYAGLYRAAYAGIKSGNAKALVAIGETSNEGRDHPKKGAPISVAPATFARLLAQQHGLRFDAYADHPYATRPNLKPLQKVRWPNVTLSQLPRFERSLDTWFHRKVPVWVTEYGYQTKPPFRYGVTPHTQAVYLSQVMRRLQADPNVQMFIWYVFRDSASAPWKSGLFTAAGTAKPAYRTFSLLAGRMDGTTETVRPGLEPEVALPVPQIAYGSPAGTQVGISYLVRQGSRVVARAEPVAMLGFDGAVRFRAAFTPVAGKTYTVSMDANDPNGRHAQRTITLVAPKPAKKTRHTASAKR